MKATIDLKIALKGKAVFGICFVLFVEFLCGHVSHAQTCASPDSSIVSWWQGEGNALDVIGGNNGTLTGNPSFGPGEVGQGFVFNGNQQGVLLGNPTNLQLQNFTIECWVARADTSVTSGAGGGGIIFGYGTYGYNFYLSNAGVPGLSKTAVDAVLSTGPTITDLNFHHLAVTKQGTTVVFYVDGVASNPINYGSVFSFTTPVAIGVQSDNLNNSFLGTIDEVSVYTNALAPYEIQAIYYAGSFGKCQPPTPPHIISQTTNVQNAFVGNTVSLSVQAGGASPLYYQWLFNNTDLIGETNATLTLDNLQETNSGSYEVIVTNAAGACTSAPVTITVSQAPACAAPPAGLISWWQGEGNALDSIGGNNGVPANNPGYGPGEVGQGFVFDGSVQGIGLGNPSNLQLQNFTIEGWIQRANTSVTSGSGGGGIIFGYGVNGYSLYLSNGGQLGLSKTAVDAVLTGGPKITDTSFHHVAVTKSGNVVVFYVDGVASPAVTYNSTFSFTTPVAIGTQGDNLNNTFLGTIDELSVYGRALSGAEVQSIYNAAVSGKCVGPVPPVILTQPQAKSVKPSANVTFSAGAAGSVPLSFQWQLNNVNIPGATNLSLSLTNVQPSDAGSYSLLVSNVAGFTLSSNATLIVNVVQAYGNNQLLTNSQYSYSNGTTITLSNYYTNGDIFYTLDGSTPNAGSTLYTGPFLVGQSSILQTLGYSPDFSQSAVSAPISILIVPFYSLSTSTAGGGRIAVTPTNTTPYASNTLITLTAMPSNGWTFLQWTGDASGTNLTNSVILSHAKSVQAVFGTKVSSTATGSGSVLMNPAGGFYPFGTSLQVSALPQAGSYFVAWGNAASGNTNPLIFMVTNANSTISSLFTTVGSGQASLTVIPLGHGHVTVNPRANVYTTNSTLTITATPDAGQSFLGWSGGVIGMQNPLSLTLTTNTTIYAHFSLNHRLTGQFGAAGFADGFVVDLSGEYGTNYQLEVSSNLMDWTVLYNLTNTMGTIHYIDTNASSVGDRFYRAVVP